jgi:septum formation topological specificity factor MinE
MSVLRKRSSLSHPVARTRLKVMIDQKRSKEEREVED